MLDITYGNIHHGLWEVCGKIVKMPSGSQPSELIVQPSIIITKWQLVCKCVTMGRKYRALIHIFTQVLVIMLHPFFHSEIASYTKYFAVTRWPSGYGAALSAADSMNLGDPGIEYLLA